jgi:non-homologous end joining protein Ku
MEDPGEFERAAPRASISAQELKMAKMLTQAMSVDEVDLNEYRDAYADEVRALIKAKVAGEKPCFSAAVGPTP